MSDSSRRAVSIRIGVSAFARVAPDRLADGDAVEAGQHQIEDDEIELLRSRELEAGVAVGGLLRRHFLQPEMQAHQFPDVRFVFHDEHVRAKRGRGLHGIGILRVTQSRDLRHVLISSELGGLRVTGM